jgi:hypothetical protein
MNFCSLANMEARSGAGWYDLNIKGVMICCSSLDLTMEGAPLMILFELHIIRNGNLDLLT